VVTSVQNMHETCPVIVRRKADGLYIARTIGNGRIVSFKPHPTRIKSRSRAMAMIRCDIGDDLEDFEIIDAPNVVCRENT
jgi:hypothetical protein